jgi:Flp pilus assembly protein TadG
MRTWGTRKEREHGATIVEFAFLLPILIILIFGIVEFGRLGFAFTEVWSAAREGARYATTVGDANGDGVPNFVDCDGIRDAARDKLAMSSLDDGQILVDYSDAGGTLLANCQGGPDPQAAGTISTGTQIKVTTVGTFDAIVPVIAVFLDGIVLDSSQVRTVNYGVLDDTP